MNKRNFTIFPTLVAAALSLFLCSPGADAAERRPNIVFILTDDLGINDLGCYGRREHHTPHLDALAAEGTRFTSAYCAQPICSPSRAAIMTGKNPARLHLTTYLPGRPDCPSQKLLHPIIRQQLPLEEKTLPEYLKEAGYVSACIGKWHLGGKGFGPAEQGFDVVYAGRANTTPSETEGGKGEYDLTAHAVKFVEENRDRPFFLYLAHNTPHIPYAAKEPLVAKNSKAFEPVYAAVIESLDDTVGLLLARLDALGLAKNTLVVFTSDNGGLHVPELKHEKITHNTPYRAGKGFLHEGGLRIPLIVRWPGRVPAGRVVNAPVVNSDWVPTLMEMCGQSVPSGLDGVSLASLLAGGEAPKRPFFWHFPHYTNQGSQPEGAVRDGDWKLIEYYEGRVELFNIANDISEKNNLAASEPDRVNQLRVKLDAWREVTGVQTNTPNPRFDAALHRTLYEDMDVSRYNASTADATEFARVLAWRKQMDAVVPKPPQQAKKGKSKR
ncbi:MAG: sulfatase [Verrucomicrobia bacterium]|nr:sulfatase [Verrucomicrobiota bacterium]